MDYIALGKSNLMVSRTAFGAMSLKDAGDEESAAILVRQAYEAGVNFFDTSHSAPESEKLLGDCLHGIRQDVILATKSSAPNASQLARDLEESLDALHTDYIDLFQYETESLIPSPDGADGIYDELEKLRSAGKILNIGLTTQTEAVASRMIAESSLFETLQYPFNLLLGETASGIVKNCGERDVGFIAMKPLFSGLVQNISLAFGFLHQFENVVPVWGVRTGSELQQILYFASHPPVIDDNFKAELKRLSDFFN
ncbi:aldo/keto reductase [Treponema parvum]|uniref:aldo/keto reductase n=1 Tax=Treponema parvum TaxID=138851 RepID=UPI001AEBDA28|nr:aldo/keto reductase [Treponema parvum]QTQ15761.1 aldo/keto reductase [Treponema parvum]